MNLIDGYAKIFCAVFDTIGTVFDTIGTVFDTIGTVFDSVGCNATFRIGDLFFLVEFRFDDVFCSWSSFFFRGFFFGVLLYEIFVFFSVDVVATDESCVMLAMLSSLI